MILVTGASGYLGSHLVKRLVAEGAPVRALVRDRVWAESEGRLTGLNVEWAEGDVTKPDTLPVALHRADAVIHTVAVAIESRSRRYEDINYQGTVNVVDAAKSAGVRRFLNICQLGADSRLPYRFLATKGKAQEYVAASGLDWTAFRPAVMWGPEDEFANSFARLVPLTPLIFPIIGDGQARFQPVWIEDVVTAVVTSIGDPSTIGEEFELAGPEVLTIAEIERRTFAALGARRLMVPVPIALLRVPVALMSLLLPAPPVTPSLLDLLKVENTSTRNAIHRFVAHPRPFTSEHAAPYMRRFTVGKTLRGFLGRPVKSG
jgi:uncharacterized protein YbjT (DUF2867 family)